MYSSVSNKRDVTFIYFWKICMPSHPYLIPLRLLDFYFSSEEKIEKKFWDQYRTITSSVYSTWNYLFIEIFFLSVQVWLSDLLVFWKVNKQKNSNRRYVYLIPSLLLILGFCVCRYVYLIVSFIWYWRVMRKSCFICLLSCKIR